MTKQKTPPVAESEEVSRVLAEGPSQGASGNGQATDNPFAVSIPSVGAYRTQDHRYYWNGKGPYPSVTTVLQVLDKPAVVQWAKRTVAEGAVNRWEEIGARLFAPMPDPPMVGGLDKTLVGEVGSETRKSKVIQWLASMPDYVKDEAGKLGTGIHTLADMASRASDSDSETFQVSDQEKPYLEAFRGFLRWLSEQGAEIVSSEKMVWSLNGYAGTYDLIVRFPQCLDVEERHDGEECDCEASELWLLDIKTSKGYYSEYALQLIAYGYADQIILEGNPDGYPMPHIHRYGVLHLRPELYPDTGYRLIEYPLVEKDYIAFLAALELYQWKQEGRYTKSRLQK